MFVRLLGILILLGLLGLLFVLPQLPARSLRADRSIVIAGETVSVEVADEEAERRKGLGEIAFLEGDQGMLFLFDRPIQPTFWMKDMRIPIDLIWIHDDRVVGFEEAIVPDDGVARYLAPEPIEAVLELRAGWVEEHNLDIGDPVSI